MGHTGPSTTDRYVKAAEFDASAIGEPLPALSTGALRSGLAQGLDQNERGPWLRRAIMVARGRYARWNTMRPLRRRLLELSYVGSAARATAPGSASRRAS
jgi:hypothetical protein